MHPSRSGDTVAFEEQFRIHYVLLCRAAYYIVLDQDAARDIVQDFFLYCWNKRHDIQITRDFKSYALRSVKNASLRYLEKSGKVQLAEIQVIEAMSEYFPEEERGEDDSRNAALWAAVSRMPEQRRKVFLMSNQEGLKYKDIAETMGISINTVKTQIKQALQFLRKECGWMMKLLTPLISWIYVG
ncbi:RNA polymerase sigma-70 factor [Chitinophaga pollutisoli]|uniref:RNA polymerase sigma-70 factor n=1 Tax=Chitinophaga pollutisoli TaxID=3133966 RepID=A0ABZ2YV07_9BACT